MLTVNKAVVGEIVIDTAVAMVTCAEADLLVSACEVTLTVITGGLGMVAGAVYRPEGVMVPQFEPAQPLPETLHDTDVFALPATCAPN